MSASRKTRSLRQQATAGRELAVLAGGPWMPAWYWRDDLEATQQASSRYPDGHPAAVLRSYHPTEDWRPHPSDKDTEGRVWKHQPHSAP